MPFRKKVIWEKGKKEKKMSNEIELKLKSHTHICMMLKRLFLERADFDTGNLIFIGLHLLKGFLLKIALTIVDDKSSMYKKISLPLLPFETLTAVALSKSTISFVFELRIVSPYLHGTCCNVII